MSQLNDDLRNRVLETVDRQPSSTIGQMRQRRVWLACIAAALALAIFFAAGGFRAWGAPRPTALIALTLVGTLAIAVATVRIGLGRGGSMSGRPRGALALTLLVVPVALFAWKIFWSAWFDSALDVWPSRFGNKCLLLSLSTGGLFLAAFVVGRRHSGPSWPGLTGAAMGLAAGALGTVVVDLWCPVGYPPHVVYGHVMPVVLLGLLGFWGGRQLLPFRRHVRHRTGRRPMNSSTHI